MLGELFGYSGDSWPPMCQDFSWQWMFFPYSFFKTCIFFT